MNIILGASGQVGSAVVKMLANGGQPVKGIVRNEKKAQALSAHGVAYAIADVSDVQSLTRAFQGGKTAFLLTPESGKEENVLAETAKILENYKNAIQESSVSRIVGLSSIGAQHDKGTGNLLMSYMLEHTFEDLRVQQIFIRPAYYFSNWLPYLAPAKESGQLPTFFPPDLSIEMISPQDLASFAAQIIRNETSPSKIYEVTGPEAYNSNDVAAAFAKVLRAPVSAQQIPREQWEDTLRAIGFSDDGVKNFVAMTQTVIDKRAEPEGKNVERLKCKTSLEAFLAEVS